MHFKQNTYSLLSLYLQSSSNSNLSHDLLERWANDIIKKNDYTFKNGIIGLGWLVDFLIQNGYMFGDANEILEDVDDNLYKFSIKISLEEPPNIDMLLELITFYQQRITNKKSTTQFYRSFTHFECLKLLLSRLNRFLLDSPVNSRTSPLKINTVLKYSFLMKSWLTESLVEEAFYTSIESLIPYLEDLSEEIGYIVDLEVDVLKLLACVVQYQNTYWIEKLYHTFKKIRGSREPSTEGMIWEYVLQDNLQPRLIYKEFFDYWNTPKGQRMFFTLCTNLHTFDNPKALLFK